jgi:cob(I)alamin adenosyltransferase
MMNDTKGLVILNTGNGKGKTTAALGLMLRAWGNDMKVVMLQFVKSPDRESGEHRAAKRLGIEIVPGGAGFVFDPDDSGQHRALAIAQLQEAKKRIASDKYDMIILDEFTYPLLFDWIPAEEVFEVLDKRPSRIHIVITGRDAPGALIDYADTAVNVVDIKHHFKKGIKEQPGIEL